MLSATPTICSLTCQMKISRSTWVSTSRSSTKRSQYCLCTDQADISITSPTLSTGLVLITLREFRGCMMSKTRAPAVPAGHLLSPLLLRAPSPSRHSQPPSESPSSRALTAHWLIVKVVPTMTKTGAAGAVKAAGCQTITTTSRCMVP